MPDPSPRLSVAAVAEHVERLVSSQEPDLRVGIELEWLTCDAADRSRRPSLAETEAVAAQLEELPAGGAISIEPGGQLELSTLPHEQAWSAAEAAADDLFAVERACRARGLELLAIGADPVREPRRVVTEPRYRAMQTHFDTRNPSGVTMMCNTASVQVNVGLGRDRDHMLRRWRLANALGPSLLAAFANSPFAGSRPSGWQSSRLRAWWQIDPSRTSPVRTDLDPATAWLEYALDANVMLIRSGERDYAPVDRPFTFREWLSAGHELGWPSEDDLDYHLTTLFPPVRPRGWFELRMFDALPTPFWHVAVAVTTALLDDDAVVEELLAATAPTRSMWRDAAQLGLAHPDLARSAEQVFDLAIESLERQDADDATVAVTEAFHDRWVARGRSPADDLLDRWRVDGSLLPRAESPLPYAEFEPYATLER